MKLNKLILILVFLILFCNFVSADLMFDEVLCKKDGSLDLSVYSEDGKILVDDVKVIAEQKDPFLDITLLEVLVNGKWRENTISNKRIIFESNVGEINNAGNYNIILKYIENNVNKELVYETECPGLIFSCNLVKVDIKNCTTVDNKYFNLLVELSGINQSISRKLDILEDIFYSVIAEKKYEDIKGLFSKKGSLPKDSDINKIDNNLYLFSKEFVNNNIFSINIYLKSLQTECKNSKIYDYKECIKISTNKIEEQKEDKKEETNIPKITGDAIKVKELGGFNKNYLIYISIIVAILLLIIVIIKKQKVNK